MQEWMTRAACRGAPRDLFFGPEHEYKLARDEREARAKEICAGCPVRAECLEYAESRNEKCGVWGGLGEDERCADRRNRQRRVRASAALWDRATLVVLL